MERWIRPDGTIDQHTTCHHQQVYGLTCGEFELLLQRAGEACEICGEAGMKLYIDHEHLAENYWGPVRGLVCPRCNAHLRRVDEGTRPLDEATGLYFRMAGAWDAAKAKAAERGETVTDVLVRALERYVKR